MGSVQAAVVVAVVLLALVAGAAHGYVVTVEANTQECFHATFAKGEKGEILYEVARGGSLDIGFSITGPRGDTVYEALASSDQRMTFTAEEAGKYVYCFDNTMSTFSEKDVIFRLDRVSNASLPDFNDLETSSLESLMKEMANGLEAVRNEQFFMEQRDVIHRAINNNTNSRVVWWSFFETLVLVCMTAGQVYYLKQFFEVRRVV